MSGGSFSFQKIKSGGQEPAFADEMCEMCPKLTFQQRVIGFICCAALGYLMAFMGTMALIDGSAEGIRTFAALYVVGNAIALCATLFLIGPLKQCKKMFHKTRRFSCLLYLSLLIIVFAVALAKQHVLLVIFLLLLEILAAIWYSASYIPYGRKMIISCLKNTICSPCKDMFKDGDNGGGDGK